MGSSGPPGRCPNGHQLGPGQVLVGHEACLGHGGGHITWTCRTCDRTVFGPPLSTHCKTLDGPATVRISTPQARSVRPDGQRPRDRERDELAEVRNTAAIATSGTRPQPGPDVGRQGWRTPRSFARHPARGDLPVNSSSRLLVRLHTSEGDDPGCWGTYRSPEPRSSNTT